MRTHHFTKDYDTVIPIIIPVRPSIANFNRHFYRIFSAQRISQRRSQVIDTAVKAFKKRLFKVKSYKKQSLKGEMLRGKLSKEILATIFHRLSVSPRMKSTSINGTRTARAL